MDFLIGGRCAGNGGLLDQEPEAGVGSASAEKTDIVPEEFVVENPALQVGDGGGFGLVVRPMNDEQSEEVGPGGFQHGLGIGQKPDLVLVAFLVRDAAQFVRRGLEEEPLLVGGLVEDSEFLVEIGSTALKARNCFAAAS